jgi:hypothetical protein
MHAGCLPRLPTSPRLLRTAHSLTHSPPYPIRSKGGGDAEDDE